MGDGTRLHASHDLIRRRSRPAADSATPRPVATRRRPAKSAIPGRPLVAWLISWLGLLSAAPAQTPAGPRDSVLSAAKAGDSIIVESKGGPITYRAVVDPKAGGDIAQLSLPAGGPVAAREVNDLFYLGNHGDEYTLRGWTGRNKFCISCAAAVASQTPHEVVVTVDLVTTGTFKALVGDEAAKATFRKTHLSYKDRTLEVRRTYRFRPDRIAVDDRMVWLHPDLVMKTFYFTAAFTPGAVQGPARLVSGKTAASFPVTTSGGRKVPDGITYPAAAETFLKNGYKVSLRTAAASFDLGRSDMYFYEKPWQQDWFQVSGFMYRLPGTPAGTPVAARHDVLFSKATAAEMPPVVTIQSPPWDARWMDETGEVPRYRIGDTVKLAATAVNADDTPVPDGDVVWDVHIDPWWNTPSATLRGGHTTYTLPEVANEVDRAKSKGRTLLAIIMVRAKGKNGTEAVEPFAVLIRRTGQ